STLNFVLDLNTVNVNSVHHFKNEVKFPETNLEELRSVRLKNLLSESSYQWLINSGLGMDTALKFVHQDILNPLRNWIENQLGGIIFSNWLISKIIVETQDKRQYETHVMGFTVTWKKIKFFKAESIDPTHFTPLPDDFRSAFEYLLLSDKTVKVAFD